MHHFSENSVGDNAVTSFPRGWGVAFHASCLLRRGLAWIDSSFFFYEHYKDISGCHLLRGLTSTLIFDVTGVNMHYLSENSAGDIAEATLPRI